MYRKTNQVHKFIAFFRVSTDHQGESGFGLVVYYSHWCGSNALWVMKAARNLF
jgi:hypothetical protein